MSAQYLAWRLLQLVPTVLGIVLVAFLLIHLAPGDPILVLAGEHGDAGYYAFMRERFGLDRSVPEQLLTFFRRVLAGDVGVSWVYGRPAMSVITDRMPATLLLMLSALGISTIAGLLAGQFSGTRVGRNSDLAVTSVTLLLAAAPVFLLGQLAIFGLAFQWRLFPIGGFRTAGTDFTGLAAMLDVARHLVLPAMVLAAAEVAAISRLTRSALALELETDHIRTARAKGVPRRALITRHAMRRILLPVLTVIGGRVGQVIAGAVIVETVFSWPGIGRLLLTSTQARDTPVLLGLFLLIACTVVLVNLLTDLGYALLDPRIRYR